MSLTNDSDCHLLLISKKKIRFIIAEIFFICLHWGINLYKKIHTTYSN